MNMASSTAFVEQETHQINFSNIQGRQQVECELQGVIAKRNSLISEMCSHIIHSGGKRLRPLLVLLSGQSIGKMNENLIKAATAAELIHTASLAHDDIIDQADTRRNKPALNAVYGNNKAALTGDYLFAEAFNILALPQLTPIMRIMVNAIQEMCDGEINEGYDLFNWEVTEAAYFKRIYQKTGVLIAACCEAGAIIGGGSEKQVEALQNYGINMGYAFQIIDDFLDFTGEQAKIGKPVGNDLRQGIFTLPVIRLLQNQSVKDKIQEMVVEKEDDEIVFAHINHLLNHSGMLQNTFECAVKYVCKAKENLKCLPESPYKFLLLNLADQVIKRQN